MRDEHIHLVGDPKENFYLLGIKDKNAFNHLLNNYHHNLLERSALTTVCQQILSYRKTWPFTQLEKWLESYCEGLDCQANVYHQYLLLPELRNGVRKLTHKIHTILPACSSMIIYCDQKKSNYHARHLDSNNINQFENYSQLISYEFKGFHKSYSFTYQGLPCPFYTANNQFFSLALHSSISEQFNLKGTPIYQIVSLLIFSCDNLKEAKELLAKSNTITDWKVILCDKEHNVLVAELSPSGNTFKRYHLTQEKFLYFTNSSSLLNEKDHFITNTKNIENAKKQKANMIMKKIIGQKSISPKNILKNFSNWENEKNQNFSPGLVQFNTVQTVLFSLNTSELFTVPGHVPKIYKGHVICYQNIFDNMISKGIGAEQIKPFHQGLNHMAIAQNFYDANQLALAYHHIQMAQAQLTGSAEAAIAEFYFIVWQYLTRDVESDYKFLLNRLQELKEVLPELLYEHSLLMIYRLQRLLGYHLTISSDDFKNPSLLKILKKEEKLPTLTLKILKKFTFPRLEILDIIYLY